MTCNHHTNACQAFVTLFLLLSLSTCYQAWAAPTSSAQSAAVVKTRSSDTEWHAYNGTPAEQRYALLDQVNTDNVQRLALDWLFDLPSGNTMTAPVMADGKLFITTGHAHIRALDATRGEQLWEFDSGARELSGFRLRYGFGNKGLAYWNGRVFTGTHDGRVIALNANTGELLWENRTIEQEELRSLLPWADTPDAEIVDHRYVNGPPRVFDGKVIIGHGGADVAPVRGHVDAFDAKTGERLWRFYTVPGNPADGFESDAMAMAAETWSGEWWKQGGGGTAWHGFSHDPDLNHLYIGVGNGYPYNHTLRSAGEGDNLFLASIVAVDIDTGEYQWHYQTTPGEQSDYTATQDMTLATLSIDGEERKVLMQAPKNGFFYVIDRTNGQLISAEPFAKVSWATHVDRDSGRPVEVSGYRYHGGELFELWPSVSGAHSWQPQSFSPRTGLVYIPVTERASLIGDKGLDLSSPGAGTGLIGDFNLGIPGSRQSFLRAWDPVAQELRWEQPTPGDWPGGTLATAGDLVFQGRIDGKFVAYHAATGAVLWEYNAATPVLAPPISYAINGRQYIVVLTGSGTTGGGLLTEGIADFRTDYRMPRRVLTFALDGEAKVPPSPAPPRRAPDPAYQPDLQLEAEGAQQFARSGCLICHGNNAVAGGAAPDLRLSPIVLSREAFQGVVRDGLLVSKGMPQFSELTKAQVESIRQYLRSLGQKLDS